MSQTKSFQFLITETDRQNYKRLDQYLCSVLENTSRSLIKLYFEKGFITQSNNTKLELKKMPKVGSEIFVDIPPAQETKTKAENIPLDILYEDEHLLFVNKPAGMVTHPAPGNYEGTLVNAILYHCKNLEGIGNEKRPGIVHRLDKGTSGVMVVAKTNVTHERLVNLFSTHDIERRYQALVIGDKFPEGGTLKSTIARHPKNRLKMAADIPGGKEAITHYKILEHFEKLTHMELKLETGRTHQIRVHLSNLLNSAILCDPLYGNPKEHLNRLSSKYSKVIGDYPHPFLHAKILGLKHPITGKDLFFEVDPPPIWTDVLKIARDQV